MDALKKIIEQLTQEATSIQIQGRALTPWEIARVQAIYQAIPHLKQALGILGEEIASTLITYKIVSDLDGRLKEFLCPLLKLLIKFLHETNVRISPTRQNKGMRRGSKERFLNIFTIVAIATPPHLAFSRSNH